MKDGLTVKGSGCVASGHPARLPRRSPQGWWRERGGRALSDPPALVRGESKRRPIPLRKRTTGTSRVTSVSAAPCCCT